MTINQITQWTIGRSAEDGDIVIGPDVGLAGVLSTADILRWLRGKCPDLAADLLDDLSGGVR